MLIVAVAGWTAALSGCSRAGASPIPFPEGAPWYNVSRPLTWRDLAGRAVLLDFFTPGCINCIHMLPVEDALKRRFGKRLAIIAVDSPKFKASASAAGLIAFIHRYRIQDPVLLDASNRLWDAYGIPAWPTFVLVGPSGKLLGSYIGEQSISDLEGPIRRALKNAPPAATLKPLPRRLIAGARLPLSAPGGIAVSTHWVAIADTAHNRIILATHHGRVLAVIGNGCPGAVNGSYRHAEFHRPHGLAFRGHRLYVADTENQLIRVVNLDTHQVSTLAGSGRRRYEWTGSFARLAANLNSPWDVLWHKNFLYVAMAGDHDIWRYSPRSRRIAVWAGSGREGLRDGPLQVAEFAQTSGLTAHDNTVYSADPESSSIRAIRLRRRVVKTLIGQGLFRFGFRNGPRTSALLQHAEGLTWVNGSLYIADTFNNALRRLQLHSGRVTTVALGLGQPQSVAALNKHDLLVPESSANRVVLVQLPSGHVDPWPLRPLSAPHCSSGG